MGSSTLIMCSFLVSLILSIMEASVVDLPLPVGPVTSTSPRGLVVMSSAAFGRPSSDRLLELTPLGVDVIASAPAQPTVVSRPEQVCKWVER